MKLIEADLLKIQEGQSSTEMLRLTSGRVGLQVPGHAEQHVHMSKVSLFTFSHHNKQVYQTAVGQ